MKRLDFQGGYRIGWSGRRRRRGRLWDDEWW